MTDNETPDISYNGRKFTITHCKGALDSYQNAIQSVPANQRKSFKRSMEQQIKRLADGHRMSKENFPSEGNLPKDKRGQSAGKFNALKRKPLRGYCWRSSTKENTYFISHYVYKNYQKLKKKDTEIICENWWRVEVNGDEC